jgi:hypothetical protein
MLTRAKQTETHTGQFCFAVPRRLFFCRCPPSRPASHRINAPPAARKAVYSLLPRVGGCKGGRRPRPGDCSTVGLLEGMNCQHSAISFRPDRKPGCAFSVFGVFRGLAPFSTSGLVPFEPFRGRQDPTGSRGPPATVRLLVCWTVWNGGTLSTHPSAFSQTRTDLS